MRRLFLAGFSATILVSLTGQAQTILNGSFETSTKYCSAAAPRQSYDTIIADSKEIGHANEIGIFGSVSCASEGTAEDGTYFLGMVSDYYNNLEDAFSLQLSSALQIGHTYHLTYFDKYNSPNLGCSLEFGVSANDSTFGTLMYSSPYFPITSWSIHTVVLKPTFAANYITVRTNTQGGGYTLVDNFQLTDLTGIEESVNQATVRIFPNPVKDHAKITFSSDLRYENAELDLFDCTGRKMKTFLQSEPKTFELVNSNLSPGIYYYRIVNESNCLANGKVVFE